MAIKTSGPKMFVIRFVNINSVNVRLPFYVVFKVELPSYCIFSIPCRLYIQSSTDKCVFCYRQSNIRRLLPASENSRALFRCLNCAQRFDYRAFGSSRKLGGAAEHLIDGSEKRICRLSFRVRLLLKGAVTSLLE